MMNISNDTCVDITTMKDLNLNVVKDNEKIYEKFIPHNNQIEKMGLMALMYKELLEQRTDAKKNMKKFQYDHSK